MLSRFTDNVVFVSKRLCRGNGPAGPKNNKSLAAR